MASHNDIPFFGRRSELDELKERCRHPGITIVMGPPRIGKSRLLREFVDRSRACESCRIGFAEAGPASGDALLRALEDAYKQWQATGGFLAEIKSIAAQMQGRWVSEVGTRLGEALASFTGPVEKLVSSIFSGLRQAKKMADSGGLQLRPLTTDEARDLLTILAHGQTVPVVVVLNQWEEGQDLNQDGATLRAFLNNPSDWPAAHVILHLRDPSFCEDHFEEAREQADRLLKHPACKQIKLGRIDLENDCAARHGVIEWARQKLPALRGVPDEDILSGIDGYAGVLDEWRVLALQGDSSQAQIRQKAADARGNQHPEISAAYEALLQGCPDGPALARLELAILAALLPVPEDADIQKQLLPPIQGTAANADLLYLASISLLRPHDHLPLSFGHPSRRETARRCVLGSGSSDANLSGSLAERLRPYVAPALNRALPALVNLHSAEAWSRLEPSTHPTSAVLAQCARFVDGVDVEPASQLLCNSAVWLFGDESIASTGLLSAAAAGLESASQAVLVALSLTNAVFHSGQDFSRADALLEEMRTLAAAHPSEAVLREQLAKGLTNAVGYSGQDFSRADALLDELRTLCRSHGEDAAVRELLARGLTNAVAYSGQDFSRADGLLDEQRTLCRSHGEDAAVREPLAYGLFNAVADSGTDFSRADGLLDELRTLCRSHGEDAAVRELLANGLFNAFHNSEPNSSRADGLLEELRTLARQHPSEAVLREQLAKGLTNALFHSGQDFSRADALLEEMRTLATEHPSEAVLREQLANGLFNAFNDSEPNSGRADALLEEMRTLAAGHRDEPGVQAMLLRACGASMRNRRADARAVAAFLSEASSTLPYCPTDDETRRVCLRIIDVAKAAHEAALDAGDEEGQTAIDEAAATFLMAYRAKWPEGQKDEEQ